MKPKLRRYFAFYRLYFEVLQNLQTIEQKEKLFEAIANYGFDQIEPNFENDPILQQAWDKVFADLSYSWEQRDSGEHGGNVSSLKKVSTIKKKVNAKTIAQDKSALNNTDELTPFPEMGEPTTKFLDFLKQHGFNFLASAPIPLFGEQMRWFVDNCGEVLTVSLIKYYENYIAENGGEDFWHQYGVEAKPVGVLIYELYKQIINSFDLWLERNFSNVAKMERTLTFSQYQQLRQKYGRANLLIKLTQLNSKKMIFKNATAFATIDNWIAASIAKAKSSKYWLPKFDDIVINANLPDCPPGYDKDFDLPCYPNINILPKQQSRK